MKDFLNPKSMLTPGIAGGLTVSISLSLSTVFGISVKWTALCISFLLGMFIVFSIKDSIPRLQRVIYCILNSLIIFSTAIGAGVNFNPPPQPPNSPPDKQIMEKFLKDQSRSSGTSSIPVLGISTAYAAESTKTGQDAAQSKPDRKDKTSDKTDIKKEDQDKLKNYLQQQLEYQQKLKEYNKRWSW